MKVYKLICHTTGNCYIGSTKNSLEWRLKTHKNPINQCRSKEIIEGGNYEMILLEEVEGTELDLLKREQYYIDTIECVNYKSAYKTKEQLIESNKKRCKNTYMRRKMEGNVKQYYDNNKDRINNWRKGNRLLHKDKINLKQTELRNYKITWGGDFRSNNNLLRIDVNLFL
tara:strand:+ start:667 stop:1176 length:510 start_codon:yes stop_codon:yes gene_type:complete